MIVYSNQSVDLTLLVTDMEGSTRVAARVGDAFAQVQQQYSLIIHAIISEHGGEVIEAAGDRFINILSNTEQALRAAIAIQRVVKEHEWPNNVSVRLRIGIHWGQVIFSDGKYIGLEVLRAAHICKAAHGEQILLSKQLVDQLTTTSVADLKIHSLGEFILRDFDDSIGLYQLDVPDLKVKFPLLRTASVAPSIAVLPFYNLNEGNQVDYLGLGIAEEIINSLSKNTDIRVVARASTFGVNRIRNIKELGELLNTSAILEGNVRKENGVIHVSAELIDVKTGADMWIKNFKLDKSKFVSVHREIAQEVIASLVNTPESVSSSPATTNHTQNIQAYEYYLKGNRFYYQHSLQNIQFARQMYQNAMQIDRNYALAYCGLSDCYAYLFMHDNRSEDNQKKAVEFSEKAIELDDTLAQAFVSNGVALSLKEEYDGAEAAFEKAVNLDPLLYEAQYQYARMAFNQGDLMKASIHFETASAIRQDDYQALLLNGQCYDGLGLKEKSIETRINGVKIAEEVLQLNPGNVRALYMGANGLVALGERQKGLEWLQSALMLDPKDSMMLYNAGCIYALCKMVEEAISCMEQAFRHGLSQKQWYLNDTNLDILRDDPRFQKLLDAM